MTETTKTIEDILHLVSKKMDLQSEQINKIQEALSAEMKEFRASRELLDDLIAEFDRLTTRQSTQLRAMIEWHEALKKTM